ncbi:hypothetical protein F4679DRAFT_31919 [Xylaria curta]|nr:hypothetical protein F4679DRAFT_31919 [Xylaria curta]
MLQDVDMDSLYMGPHQCIDSNCLVFYYSGGPLRSPHCYASDIGISAGGTKPGGSSSAGTCRTGLMTLAGFPTATMKGGMSLVTTLPAPIVQPRPMVTPAKTITFPPSQQSSPMIIGAPSSGPFVPLRTRGSVGWPPEKKEQLGPNKVRSPMMMGAVSIQVELLLMKAYLTL